MTPPTGSARPAVSPTDEELDGLRASLLGAAESFWRDFPWRATRDPWCVLVSEVMLQQTQAARAVEPYRRFVERFPTAAACATAGVADVVRAWAGLGYNRRAVHLHRAAVEIQERHGGAVPGDLPSLRALPGVGDYTARAVLALAFGAAVGAVDANAARVLARAVSGAPLTRREAQGLADRLVPAGAPWRFSQAMFDLGARVCVARAPACSVCPLEERCRWAAAGGGAPDPAATRRRQSRFEGSDRQGRGKLVHALRSAPVAREEIAAASGWPGDDERAQRVAASLCADGVARWDGSRLALA